VHQTKTFFSASPTWAVHCEGVIDRNHRPVIQTLLLSSLSHICIMGEAHICIFERMLLSTCEATSVPFCSFLFYFSIGCLLLWIMLCAGMASIGITELGISILRAIYSVIRYVFKAAAKRLPAAADKRLSASAAAGKLLPVCAAKPAAASKAKPAAYAATKRSAASASKNNKARRVGVVVPIESVALFDCEKGQYSTVPV